VADELDKLTIRLVVAVVSVVVVLMTAYWRFGL
jgi:hypothetical protein